MEVFSLRGSGLYTELRGIALPNELGDLQARHAGVVILPISLAWSGKRDFDLDDPYYLLRFYERIITEARHPDVLCDYLNAEQLQELWADLYLSPFVRQAWEAKFPELVEHGTRFSK